MNIAIVGSRKFPNLKMVQNYIDRLYLMYRPFADFDPEYDEPITIVSGGADGVDSTAILKADNYSNCGFDIKVIEAEWDDITKPDSIIKTHPGGKKYDAFAGLRRNKDIVACADKVVAFWDGVSKGTKHTIDIAIKNKVDVEIIFPPKGRRKDNAVG